MAEQAYIVTDLGYGDAGKGTTVDYLVRQADSAAVVLHSGGAQRAHNVVTSDGRHHTFSQFGSGAFVSGVKSHLAAYFLINPVGMLNEGDHLEQLGVARAWEQVSVDVDAVVITPWQQSANRLRELARGAHRHGSCGQGIGETQADRLRDPNLAIYVHDLHSPVTLRRKLQYIRGMKQVQLKEELGTFTNSAAREEWAAFGDDQLLETTIKAWQYWLRRVRVVDGDYLQTLERQHELLVFEGAQGVLLDEWYGFHPYTTWSTTTHANALALLEDIQFGGEVTRLGVIRAYGTRHGAGPFVTEDVSLGQAIPEYHNGVGPWQGDFRIGHLDLLSHRYAQQVCGGTDGLVVTGLDRLAALPTWHYANEYRLKSSASDVSRFFELAGDGLLTAIKPGIQGDLDYQGRLTELVLDCEPHLRSLDLAGYEDIQTGADAALEVVAELLGTPVSIASFGPTASDKRAVVPV